MARREREEKRREMAGLLVLPGPAEYADRRRLQRKNFNILGMLKIRDSGLSTTK